VSRVAPRSRTWALACALGAFAVASLVFSACASAPLPVEEYPAMPGAPAVDASAPAAPAVDAGAPAVDAGAPVVDAGAAP